MAHPPHVAIAVVGAGPAGATIARLLARQGRQVLLIDASRAPVSRLEMLAPAAMGVVQALAIEDIMRDPAIARPCAGIRRRWTSHAVEFDDFLRQPGGRGFIVDRARFDARLHALARSAGAAVIDGQVVGVCREHHGFVLEVASGATATNLSASLVVDATGRTAALACRLGAERTVSERLVARCECFDLSAEPSQDAVWLDVETHGGSWIYATSGPDGRREAWSVHRQEDRRTVRGDLINASAVCLTQAAGRGWIAIGDAASAFDPIASQGLFNALSSALVAAGAIASEGSITDDVAADYSVAMMSTFMHSERDRMDVYRAMRSD